MLSPTQLPTHPPTRSLTQTQTQTLHLLKHSPSLHVTNQIHAHLIRHGLHSNFHPSSSTFPFNLLIRAHHHSPSHSLLLFHQLLHSNSSPDKFTLTFLLKILSTTNPDLQRIGRVIHGFAVKGGVWRDIHFRNTLMSFYFESGDGESGRKVFEGMRVRSVVTWSGMVGGLVKCGDVEGAREVFEGMPVRRNVVAWTAMIGGCARSGRADEAFELFWRMLEDNIRPNDFTLVALLIACTELGSLSMGRWVHKFAHKNNGLDTGIYVGTALIDMYSKCGSLEDAVKVFNQMPVRSVATWNSMIMSLAVHGFGREAVMLFKDMDRNNVRPDDITLFGVLCACVREEMLQEGWRLFRYMSNRYGIKAGIKHCKCLVQLFDWEEVEIVKDLVMELDNSEQNFLRIACREEGNLKLEEAISGCTREVECFTWEVG